MRIAIVIGILLAAIGALGMGCATAGTGRPPSMGCEDPLAADCDDPSAYPPLTLQLPRWPFPRLLKPLPEKAR